MRRMAICCTSFSRRWPISGTTNMAAALKGGCVFRWRFSMPCARPSRRSGRFGCGFPRRIGWKADGISNNPSPLRKRLRERGSAALHVSSGGLSPTQKIPLAPGYQVPLATAAEGGGGAADHRGWPDHRSRTGRGGDCERAKRMRSPWRARFCMIRTGHGMRRPNSGPRWWRRSNICAPSPGNIRTCLRRVSRGPADPILRVACRGVSRHAVRARA